MYPCRPLSSRLKVPSMGSNGRIAPRCEYRKMACAAMWPIVPRKEIVKFNEEKSVAGNSVGFANKNGDDPSDNARRECVGPDESPDDRDCSS